jgi:hypothetical protein
MTLARMETHVTREASQRDCLSIVTGSKVLGGGIRNRRRNWLLLPPARPPFAFCQEGRY